MKYYIEEDSIFFQGASPLKFNPKLSWEFLSADEIASKTIRALRNHIKHVKEVSPYYKEAFWDIAADDIKHLDDFHRLAFTGRTSSKRSQPAAQPGNRYSVP